MSTLMEELEKDPFIGTPIPGQSLTATPGSMPYENPAMTSNPEEAYDALKAGLYQPENQRQIGHLTRAGISCETLASSMVMIAFTKGMFNPDVAEIIKPFIAVEMFKIAKDQGVDKVIFENKPMDRGIDTNSLEELKSLIVELEKTPGAEGFTHNPENETKSLKKVDLAKMSPRDRVAYYINNK